MPAGPGFDSYTLNGSTLVNNKAAVVFKVSLSVCLFKDEVDDNYIILIMNVSVCLFSVYFNIACVWLFVFSLWSYYGPLWKNGYF